MYLDSKILSAQINHNVQHMLGTGMFLHVSTLRQYHVKPCGLRLDQCIHMKQIVHSKRTITPPGVDCMLFGQVARKLIAFSIWQTETKSGSLIESHNL